MAETLPLAKIKIGKRRRRDMGDIKALAKSIEEIGLLHPIVIDEKRRLIAGQRRMKALLELGRQEAPVHIVNIPNLARGELDENFMRKDFLPSERVAIGRVSEPEVRKEAEKRMKAGVPCADSAQGNEYENKARQIVARRVGWSHFTYTRACAIVDAAQEEPEKYGKLLEEMDKAGRVNGIYRRLIKLKDAEKQRNEPPPLPDGPFRVIVADPPWDYKKRREDSSQRGKTPYATMTHDDILAYCRKWPDSFVHKESAILWLWTTNAHMREAYEVLDAWQFEPKTILTWVKDKMGLGDWLRGQTEHCLMAVRGKPIVTLTNQTTVLHAAAGKHSAKPESFYRLVDSLCPGAKVELFSRTQSREGWVTYGLDKNIR